MKTAIGVLAVLTFLGTGSILWPTKPTESPQWPEQSLFQLPLIYTDADETQKKLEHFAGRPLVLTMAYSTCRRSCPVILQKLRAIEAELDSPEEVDFVIVSLKPKEDSPAQLKSFARHQQLDKANWHFLTGSPEDVRKLSLLLSLSYQQAPNGAELMHSNVIHLLSPQGVIKATLFGLEAELQPLLHELRGFTSRI